MIDIKKISRQLGLLTLLLSTLLLGCSMGLARNNNTLS